MIPKLLAVFDFDHTIIEDNSDIVVRKLIPCDIIPDKVKNLYKTNGWTLYMQEIFKLLHKHNITETEIRKAMESIPAVEKMDELLKWLKESNSEVIIISDSNSFFINHWLAYNDLNRCVTETFTNPAQFNADGLLCIQMYHRQNWCDISTENLCKGSIMENYINRRRNDGVIFDKVAYIGDGNNDFCPSLKLRKHDLLFPRDGFKLIERINNGNTNKVQASIHLWNDGKDILNILQNCV